MPSKKYSSPIKGRLVSKSLAQKPIDEEAVEEKGKDFGNVREEPKGVVGKSVVIIEKPKEAMVGQGIPVRFATDEDFGSSLMRIGTERLNGSLFHCIFRAIYPPYMEWDRERRLRKVREFRQDLASNFDGYYLRLDQRNISWPGLVSCKKDLESCDGAIQYDFLDYIGKVINKNIVVITVTREGVIQPVLGSRVYGRDTKNNARTNDSSSPIIYSKAEPVYVFIVHLGGPAFELLSMRKNGTNYTLFPESHLITTRILGEVLTN